MRKAIRLRVSLWVEGEQEPAADFAALTTTRVREILERAAKQEEQLRISVRGVKEDPDEEEDEEGEEGDGAAGGRGGVAR